MDSPQILVPASTESPDMVIADLGHLSLKSSFAKKEYGEVSVMDMDLTNTRINVFVVLCLLLEFIP